MTDLSDAVSEAVEKASDAGDGAGGDNLNGLVALSVAIVATFTALCNVKGGNIGQAMATAQSNLGSAWAYFQAKGTKLNIVDSARETLRTQREITPGLTAEARAHLDKQIAEYDTKIATYEKEKAEIKQAAEGYQAEYDGLGVRDDQFDMAEATASIAIALFGITALTRKRRLLYVAWAFSGFGLLLGISGFAGLGFHVGFLAKLLG
jgi:hypothetical protein